MSMGSSLEPAQDAVSPPYRDIGDSSTCAYLLEDTTRTPRVIHRCAAPSRYVVLVPLKQAGGMFFGAGVRVVACEGHATILETRYGGRVV